MQINDEEMQTLKQWLCYETALVCVWQYELAFDKIMGTILIVIDLSAAFDTINHVRRLRDRYVIIVDVMKGVESYKNNISDDVNQRIILVYLLSSAVTQSSLPCSLLVLLVQHFLSSVPPGNFPAQVTSCRDWRKRLCIGIINLHEEMEKVRRSIDHVEMHQPPAHRIHL